LANFGTATITNASGTINGKTGPIDSSSWQNTAINMVTSSGALKASTGGLKDSTSGGSTTSSFSVTWKSSGPVARVTSVSSKAAANAEAFNLVLALGDGYHHHSGSLAESWLW
jgi:hypothetical protein